MEFVGDEALLQLKDKKTAKTLENYIQFKIEFLIHILPMSNQKKIKWRFISTNTLIFINFSEWV